MPSEITSGIQSPNLENGVGGSGPGSGRTSTPLVPRPRRPRSWPCGSNPAGNHLDSQREPTRLKLAERNQVPFVVEAADRSVGHDGNQTIARPILRIEAHASDQRGSAMGGPDDRLASRLIVLKQERARRL